jgi:alpha-mannosidase
MAMPAGINKGQVTYEVPFGEVRVGKDEISGAAGGRYKKEASEMHPRGINDWIGISNNNIGFTLSSSVAAADYIDPTDNPVKYPILQPILLASRHSCNGRGLLYAQNGTHHFMFSLTSFKGKNDLKGHHNADGVNEPMTVVFNPTKSGEANLPESMSFYSVNAPNIQITTIKKAEDSNDVIVRFYDEKGMDKKNVTIHSFKPIRKAEVTNMIENKGKPISHSSHEVKLNVGHNSIETIELYGKR